ncbi:hypothetical protein OOK31_32030 [Streptomyces sp. NBC_00249]|nr:hypothetical protein [Streptomyces sp. NBC_00249]MCX5198460.1 hypothetical protein [Streptomyces sp. NBC_00249]
MIEPEDRQTASDSELWRPADPMERLRAEFARRNALSAEGLL